MRFSGDLKASPDITFLIILPKKIYYYSKLQVSQNYLFILMVTLSCSDPLVKTTTYNPSRY